MKQAGNEFGGEAIRVVGRTLVCSRSDRKAKESEFGFDDYRVSPLRLRSAQNNRVSNSFLFVLLYRSSCC